MPTGNEFVDAINAQPDEPVTIPGEAVESQNTQENPESKTPEVPAQTGGSNTQDPNVLLEAIRKENEVLQGQEKYSKAIVDLALKGLGRDVKSPAQQRIDQILQGKDPNTYLTVQEQRDLNQAYADLSDEKTLNTKIAITEKYARQLHEDYDEVVDNLALPKMAKDSRLFDLVMSSDDPAEAAYLLGTQDPIYQEYLRSEYSKSAEVKSGQKADRLISKIEDHLTKPSTIASAPSIGKSTGDKVKDVMNMPRDDFEKLRQSVIDGNMSQL